MTNQTPYERYLLLAHKWVEGTISEEELKEYTDWLRDVDPEAIVSIPPDQATNKAAHRKQIFQGIQSKIDQEKHLQSRRIVVKLLQRAAVVAGIALLVIFLFPNRKSQVATTTPEQAEISPTDIQPGTNGAVLTLANGKVIILDTASNGTLHDHVLKNTEALVFEPVNNSQQVQFNTLSTPRARQQHLILPDGSKVWLNAESSIRFPNAFIGETREIDITGEVYFEITHDKKKPFIVKSKEASITVLGTHFNVMSYPNETFLETTLLEGAVRYNFKQHQVLLKPGQQARTSKREKTELVPDPDLELVMAWKNGFQSFRKTDINAILRQITRWYDVDVVAEQDIPSDITFSGDIPREVTLTQLLKALESKQLHFSLDAPHKKVHLQYTP